MGITSHKSYKISLLLQVNVLTAGVVAGAAFGAGTRNWKQVAGATGLVCLLCHVAEDSR